MALGVILSETGALVSGSIEVVIQNTPGAEQIRVAWKDLDEEVQNAILGGTMLATIFVPPNAIAIIARLDRLGPDVDTILTNSQNGTKISAQGDGSTAQIGVTAFISRDPLSTVIERDEFGNEIMFRTMSQEDFYELERTGRVPSTGETSISPVFSYSSENYDGVTVMLVTKPDTSFELQQIGVSANDATRLEFPYMPESQAGWAEDHARFKVEKEQMTTQLGQGAA